MLVLSRFIAGFRRGGACRPGARCRPARADQPLTNIGPVGPSEPILVTSWRAALHRLLYPGARRVCRYSGHLEGCRP